MVIRLDLNNFTELERQLKRERHIYYLFCIINETGVIVQYPSFTSAQAMGFNSRLYVNLTKDIDKVYNVVIEHADAEKGRTWHMIVPTKLPDEFRKAILTTYGNTNDVDKTGENTF